MLQIYASRPKVAFTLIIFYLILSSLGVNFGVLIMSLFLHVDSIFDCALFVNKSAILAAFDKYITPFSC